MLKFVSNDLRRTVQSHMSELVIKAIMVEKVLSHELQGMLRVYNQYDYMKERKAALELWNQEVSKVMERK